jgi:hypothetical protein
MGIDIYAESRVMTNAEKEAQVCCLGFLHETHHSGPYAIKVLAPEAFEERYAEIPAATLQDRLPAALIIAETCQRQEYGVTDPKQIDRVLQRYRDFVALCARWEANTGSPCIITASW